MVFSDVIVEVRRLLTHVKGKDKPEDRPGAVYKIHCSDCQATYIGETGRNLTTRLTEHKRATKKGEVDWVPHGLRDSFWWLVSYLRQVSQVAIISFNSVFMFGQNIVCDALCKQLCVPRCEACSFCFMPFRGLTETTICCLWSITPSCTENSSLMLK